MAIKILAETLYEKLAKVRDFASRTKQYCQETSAALRAGDVSANVVIDVYLKLIQARDTATGAFGDPEIIAYLHGKHGDQSTEFQSLAATLNKAIDWVVDNFPHDQDGYLLKDQMQQDGIAVRQFDPAEMAGLCGLLDALVASIE